jgi:glucose/arabinose dehydrogenase
MKNKIPSPLILILLAVLLISACAPATSIAAGSPELPAPAVDAQAAAPDSALSTPAAIASAEPEASGWALEVVAEGLEIPWSIVFPSAERMLVSERTGAIREIKDGVLNPQPVYIFDEVRARDEAGLMGLALHPDHTRNGYLYACYTVSGSATDMITRVSRLVDNGTSLAFEQVILDNIPAARFHTGCRIQFGPDGMLYVSTGDATNKDLPQDVNSSAGKILRVTPEGEIPADNPFPGSPVFSLGHRNPQGITWDLESGRMFSTEHGPSTFDGPPGGDEINLIIPGGNYGWPLGSHDNVPQGTIGPLIQFTPAEAPASALFYADDALPFFKGNLFFGALRGEGLVRVILNENANGEISVASVEKIIADVGRVRDVVTGPDGSLYFSTSNRDGRGAVRDGDDKIYRIFPIYE